MLKARSRRATPHHNCSTVTHDKFGSGRCIPLHSLQGSMCLFELSLKLEHSMLQLFCEASKVEDPPDAGEADAFAGQLLNLAKAFNVMRRVPPPATRRTLRRHESDAVVLPERLWVHASDLRYYRDRENGCGIEVVETHRVLTPFRQEP